MCYLENVREVSQVEDVVEAYRCREEVLTDFLVQTDSCLHKQNQKMDSCRNGWLDIGTERTMGIIMDRVADKLKDQYLNGFEQRNRVLM